MKIVFSNYDDTKNPYYAGGGARAVHEVAKYLAKENQVTVITGKYPGSKDEVVDGVGYVRRGVAGGGPKAGQLMYQLCLFPVLLKGEFDVWVESFTPPFSTSFLPAFSHKPVIGLVHMLAAQDMTRKYKLPIFQVIENLGLGLYKHFITLSEEIRKKIEAVNTTADMVIIPNGVAMSTKPKSRPKAKHILFLGRIEMDQKGLDLLLEAYSKIQKKIKYPLVIAGSGEKTEMEKAKRIINQLGMTRRVHLIGRVDEQEKRRLFEDAVFVTVPSRFETFSLVALEAMAAGKGLITFDIKAFKWIPEEAVIKSPCFDVSQFAHRMLELCENKSLSMKMGKAGESYAKKLSWKNVSKLYAQFIYKTVKEVGYA